MATFVPRVRRTATGFYPEIGQQYCDAPPTPGSSVPTLEEARAALAEQLRHTVRPGDRVEVDGGSYPNLDKAARAAPVLPAPSFVAQPAPR